ncbi:hypothetical protein [Bifidobacterium xylocopae]|nr:hypothetical protein [Bifidobacterium xylocopae]
MADSSAMGGAGGRGPERTGLDAQRPGGMVTGSDNQPFEAHTPDGV